MRPGRSGGHRPRARRAAVGARRGSPRFSGFVRVLPWWLAVQVAACADAAVLAPTSPLVIENTPLAGGLGVVATASATPGPSPTPSPATTRQVNPLEPLNVPPGFQVGVFADGIGPVWKLEVASNGDVVAALPARNALLVLPDRDHDGVADGAEVFAAEEGLNQPYGLAIRPGWLYVATTDRVLRYRYAPGDVRATGPPELLVDLPGEGFERARGLAFGPDGLMYVSVGASCDVCDETDPRRAAVLQFDASGGAAKRFAGGVRATTGLAFHPDTGELWGGDVGRSGLGDDLPPDELNRLAPGDFGWPRCFGDRVFDPTLGGDRTICASTTPPVVLLPAHVGPRGAAFYTGSMFPAAYAGDLFLALHGSGGRRSVPIGYSVVRVPFTDGEPTGEVFDFVSGWLRPDTRRWGSPVDVAMAPDGALLVADDGGGRIYRVAYAATPTPTPRIQ